MLDMLGEDFLCELHERRCRKLLDDLHRQRPRPSHHPTGSDEPDDQPTAAGVVWVDGDLAATQATLVPQAPAWTQKGWMHVTAESAEEER
jgi:hypothetical protein